jgi:pyrimidine 5'-nucleotidase
VRYRTLFFDLDDTLYSHTAGLWEAIRQRMDLYMEQRLGLSKAEIPRLRKHYLETFGTTLRGLQNHLHVDAQDFLAFVHDLPLDHYLQPNPRLRMILLSLPQRRWILTNADRAHAMRVLNTLGLTDCFQEIIDVNLLGFIPKPDPAAFRKALELTHAEPSSSVFFDDAARNLIPAQHMGFTTVLVGAEEEQPQNGFDLQVSSLEEITSAFPELWESNSAQVDQEENIA